jgi:hypothetical protein
VEGAAAVVQFVQLHQGDGEGSGGHSGRIEVDTGAYNPVLGVSYSQIAGMSRSMHRSQGMGASQRPGPSRQFLVPVAGDAPAKDAKDAFDGIDTTWKRVPGGAEIGAFLEEAVRTFEPDHPERTIPLLLKAHPQIAAHTRSVGRAKSWWN